MRHVRQTGRSTGSVAKSAPVAGLISVTTNGAVAERLAPSTHSTYPVTEMRRLRPDRLAIFSREILTGSPTGTNCRSSSAIPFDVCVKRLYPCPCAAEYAVVFSRIGSAVGPHSWPVSSSRR